ncbi:MAG: two-component system response regulator [Magnetococcales bacterium]|nr:two-component system response regulator [Magnetococcales bacterium]
MGEKIMNNEEKKPTILMVDDMPVNLKVLATLLSPDYTVVVATSGQEALQVVADETPDMILLDIAMPEMDGYEVLRCLKSNHATRNIPVIFITAMVEVDDETKGLALGAVDYITKPFSLPIVKARVQTHLALTWAQNQLKEHNRLLEEKVAQRTQELLLTQDVTINALASLAETRDNETGNHIRRTQHYVRLLAERLRDHPKFRACLDGATIELLFKSAPLHDMGKVGVPDTILLKPGPLTEVEFAVMQTHTTLGRDAITIAAGSPLSGGVSFLRYIQEIAYTHHEKWDGSGYPEGLAGEQIPLSGRLMAIADVYDALISKRVYKPAFPHEQAVAIITEGKGSHFDPDMVEAFLAVAEAFQDVAYHFADLPQS